MRRSALAVLTALMAAKLAAHPWRPAPPSARAEEVLSDLGNGVTPRPVPGSTAVGNLLFFRRGTCDQVRKAYRETAVLLPRRAQITAEGATLRIHSSLGPSGILSREQPTGCLYGIVQGGLLHVSGWDRPSVIAVAPVWCGGERHEAMAEFVSGGRQYVFALGERAEDPPLDSAPVADPHWELSGLIAEGTLRDLSARVERSEIAEWPAQLEVRTDDWHVARLRAPRGIITVEFTCAMASFVDFTSRWSEPPVAVTLGRRVVTGGESLTGTVTISAKIPDGGSVVHLLSANPAVAQVPATVTIPEGQGEKRVSFPITTTRVQEPTPLQISAALGGFTAVAVLECLPR
jgi:hypothetical protein